MQACTKGAALHERCSPGQQWAQGRVRWPGSHVRGLALARTPCTALSAAWDGWGGRPEAAAGACVIGGDLLAVSEPTTVRPATAVAGRLAPEVWRLARVPATAPPRLATAA